MVLRLEVRSFREAEHEDVRKHERDSAACLALEDVHKDHQGLGAPLVCEDRLGELGFSLEKSRLWEILEQPSSTLRGSARELETTSYPCKGKGLQ